MSCPRGCRSCCPTTATISRAGSNWALLDAAATKSLRDKAATSTACRSCGRETNTKDVHASHLGDRLVSGPENRKGPAQSFQAIRLGNTWGERVQGIIRYCSRPAASRCLWRIAENPASGVCHRQPRPCSGRSARARRVLEDRDGNAGTRSPGYGLCIHPRCAFSPDCSSCFVRSLRHSEGNLFFQARCHSVSGLPAPLVATCAARRMMPPMPNPLCPANGGNWLQASGTESLQFGFSRNSLIVDQGKLQ